MSEKPMVYLSMVRDLKRRSAEEQARVYQAFESVEQMDNRLQNFVGRYGMQLSDSALTVLEYLARHSLKVIGVSWLAINSIAQLAGLSDRSVQRILKQLEDWKIIKRIRTEQPKGGQGVNLIVIQPDEEMLNQNDTAALHEVKAAAEEVTACSSFDKPVTGSNSGHVAESEAQYSINLLNLSKPSKAIDIDYYTRIDAKLSNSRFVDSNLYKWAIQKIESIKLPVSAEFEIYHHMIHELDWSEFMHDTAADLYGAVMLTGDKFNTFYRSGHRISSYGAYFVTIFKDQLQRKRQLRLANLAG